LFPVGFLLENQVVYPTYKTIQTFGLISYSTSSGFQKPGTGQFFEKIQFQKTRLLKIIIIIKSLKKTQPGSYRATIPNMLFTGKNVILIFL